MWRMSLIAMRFSGFVDAFTHHRKRFGESTEKAFMRAFGGADASPCQRKERHKMEEKEKSPLWRVLHATVDGLAKIYDSVDPRMAEERYEKSLNDPSLAGNVLLESPEGITVRQRTTDDYGDYKWRVVLFGKDGMEELLVADDAVCAEEAYEKYCSDASLKGVLSMRCATWSVCRQRIVGKGRAEDDFKPKVDHLKCAPSPKENRPIAGEAYEKCCSDNPWKVMLSKGREFVELYASRDRKLAESYYEKYCEDASLKGTVSLEDPEGQTVRQRMGFISDEDRWGPGYRPEIVEKGGINDNIFSTLAEAARYFEQNPDADVLPEETPTVPSKKTVPPKSDPGGS